MLNATLACLRQTEIADIGDQYILGATRDTKLGYKIANGARTAHDHIFVLHIGPIAGMGAHGRRFYHRSIVETHAFRQLCHAVVIHNEEVLCRAIRLESLHTQMLTDIILSTLTRIALAADQLWTSRDVVARLADAHSTAYSHYHTRILMALDHWIEGGGVKTVVRVNLTSTDTDAFDVDEDLVSS